MVHSYMQSLPFKNFIPKNKNKIKTLFLKWSLKFNKDKPTQ